MADRIPLIVNSNAKQIQELPTTDALLIHSGAGKGLEFTNNPGGGTGDIASITYEVVSGEKTNLKIAVANDSASSNAGPDNIELSTPNGASVNITSNTTSTSSTSGALVVTGGVGISKKLFVGDTTQSSSTTTGALVVAGGVGISKKLNIGNDLTIEEGQLNLTGTSAAGDSDINLSGGSDGLAVVTNTTNSGKISFVTKNSGGTNSTIQLEHQKVNFSGPNISGTAVSFEPKGAAPIYGVRAHGRITACGTGGYPNGTFIATPGDGLIANHVNNVKQAERINDGIYEVEFEHAMPNAHYTVVCSPEWTSGAAGGGSTADGRQIYIDRQTSGIPSTTKFRVRIFETDDNVDPLDQSFYFVVIG